MSPTTLFCTDTFWEDRGDDVVAIDPTVEVIRLVGDEQVIPGDLDRITVAFLSPDTWLSGWSGSASFLGTCIHATRLDWLHSGSAGTDHPVFARLREQGVKVTNSAGASAPSIAQTVMAYLLALSRDFPKAARDQAARRWDRVDIVDLHGLRLGIVGLGAIGTETARLAQAFGMEVIGLRRSPTGSEPCEVWTNDRLSDLLGWADAIAVTAPLTAQTRRLFGADAFAAMRPGAWFINVGRGEIVDEDALTQSLVDGHLAGAACDVFVTEPLPATSDLWAAPNLIITPHLSGNTDRTNRRACDLFIENFRRYSAGEPLSGLTTDQG